MRQITKTIALPVDSQSRTFRLKKLDAFSGASLLRLLSAHLQDDPAPSPDDSLILRLFSAIPDDALRSLMTACLSHAEVRLDAGWQPVMEMGEWSWSDLEYDPVNALKLTLQVILWTLDGFFAASGPDSPAVRPAS